MRRRCDRGRPVVAVCATRTGCGKSQTSRVVARCCGEAGLRVALVRHPMPYGALGSMRVQRFATLADIDVTTRLSKSARSTRSRCGKGMVMFAGVDYADILAAAEQEADVIVWDGGNNDLPFFAPDLMIVVADALRPGHELGYHPGEVNVRLADVVVVNKVDSAAPADLQMELDVIRALNPDAAVITATSPPVLEPGPDITGQRVLVIDDGPTLTHGGMPFGAGMVAARAAAAEIVDPRPYAVGSLLAVYERFPHLGAVLPAMGYGVAQLADLVATIAATPCDVVVTGTPIDLGGGAAQTRRWGPSLTRCAMCATNSANQRSRRWPRCWRRGWRGGGAAGRLVVHRPLGQRSAEERLGTG